MVCSSCDDFVETVGSYLTVGSGFVSAVTNLYLLIDRTFSHGGIELMAPSGPPGRRLTIFSAPMKRRDFLRNTGWFVVGASLVGLPGCPKDDDDSFPDAGVPPEGTYQFPQGVASGDPREASVVVWTRVAPVGETGAQFGSISLRVQVSSDAGFGTLVVDQDVQAAQGSDHTVRVLVTGLSPATDYYYRFVAGKDSITGRT